MYRSKLLKSINITPTGPVVRVSPDEVAINDVGAAKEIHKVGGRYLKAGFYEHIGHKSAKTLFSTQDPRHHAIRRRLLSAPMSETSLKQFEPVVLERVRLCVQRMGEELKSRGAIDVFKWWTFLATDTIGELAFGDSFRMLEIGQKNQYSRDLEDLSSFMAVRTTFPFLTNVSAYVPIPLFKRAAAMGARMGQYAAQSIERYRKLIAANPSDPKPTLFTKVFNAGENGLTDAEIRLEAGGYIAAGSDTTAITLTYLVWAVCSDPAVRQKLVAELSSVPERPDDNDVKDLPYLGRVIQETLRLFPAVPGALPRAVPQEGASLAGARLPGGVTVSTQAYSLHRDPALFPDPERFDPDRWADPSKDMKAAFMPFGGGSRSKLPSPVWISAGVCCATDLFLVCIGMHLAWMEMRLAAATFFKSFPNAKVSAREGFESGEMEQKMYFLVSPKGHRCLIDNA